MKTHLPLEGFTIIDLTTRLPGPLATYHLLQQGAQIIKVEDTNYPDPFSISDEIFSHWYKNINQHKKIIKLNFKIAETASTLKALLENADGAIIALPEKVRSILNLDKKTLIKNYPGKIFINIFADKKSNTSLHDLGAITRSHLIQFHLNSLGETQKRIPPPFLPVAGIHFASMISQTFLSGLIYSLKTHSSFYKDLYLSEITEDLSRVLLPQDYRVKQSAHNGSYPAYNLYRLIDKSYIALSLLEERYWMKFLFATGLDKNLSAEDRFFNNDRRVFTILEEYFSNKSFSCLKDMICSHQLQCIDLIDNKTLGS